MKKVLLCLFLLLSINLFSQINTFGTGDWNNTTTWIGGVIPISTDNVIIGNTHVITIYDGETFNISELWLGNNSVINVYGTLVMDSLHINNNATLNVSGVITITGGASLANNTILTINNTGTVNITGDVETGNAGTQLIVDGNMTIGGDLIGDASVSGTGSVSVTGTVDPSITDLGPLPIELLYFKSTYNVNHTKLYWSTAVEINNDYFIIEYSTDAVNWNTLTQVYGAGNSMTTLKYEYNHYTTINYYYRLAQVDYDGKSETFDIVHSNSPFLNENRLYEVYDINGRQLKNSNIKNLPHGVFLIKNGNEFSKIIH